MQDAALAALHSSLEEKKLLRGAHGGPVKCLCAAAPAVSATASSSSPNSASSGGAGVGAFVLGMIAEHTGLRPPIATAAVIGMVIWYTVWRQRRVIVQSLQTTMTPSKQGK